MTAETQAQWAGVIVALAVGGASLFFSQQGLDRQEDRLDRQEDRLDRQEDRLDRQEEEKFAAYVELGEVPQYAYGDDGLKEKMPPRKEGIWWAVINASPIRITGVWVKASDGQFIWIDEVQRCTYYVLQPDSKDFKPTTVYFKDPWIEWNRSEGKLGRDYEEPPRDNGEIDDNGIAHVDVVQDCA